MILAMLIQQPQKHGSDHSPSGGIRLANTMNLTELADSDGGARFAAWAMPTLHALRIELSKSFRMATDLYRVLSGFLADVRLTRLLY